MLQVLSLYLLAVEVSLLFLIFNLLYNGMLYNINVHFSTLFWCLVLFIF